jgi:hypothetical protein
MSNTDKFPSKLTRVDEFLAPYSVARFERIATAYGRRWMALAAAVGLVMVCASIAMTGGIIVIGLQRAYLAAVGIETRADVFDVVMDTPTRLGSSKMATLNYTFKARNGESIVGSLRRSPWEFVGIAPGNRIELLYADHWPQINLPRIGFRNSTLLAFMGLVSLALSVHLVLFLMKYRAWRRRIMSVSQPTRE